MKRKNFFKNNQKNIIQQQKKVYFWKNKNFSLKIFNFYSKIFFRKKICTQTRLAAICKLTGTFKKTNKKTNSSRHIIRWQKNNKFLDGWSLKEW